MENVPAARVLLLVPYRPEYGHGWGSKTYYPRLRLDAAIELELVWQTGGQNRMSGLEGSRAAVPAERGRGGRSGE